MYKLSKGEGLYRVADNKYIVANYVDNNPNKIICRFQTELHGNTITRDKEYQPGEVGIFWNDDLEDKCSTVLNGQETDICDFHEALASNGFVDEDYSF